LFCNGTSNPIAGLTINLKGSPLKTTPVNALGATDTVVDRPFDAPFNGGLQTTTSLKIRALSLVGVTSFSIFCPNSGVTEVYNVSVSLNGPQTFGTIIIRRPSTAAAGGDFDASFQVAAKVVFKNAATGVSSAPVPDNVTITTLNACWTHAAPTGAVVWPGAVTIDTNGDQVPDYPSPYGTSNFFAGGCGGPVNHQGPHPSTCNAPGPNCPSPPVPVPCTPQVIEYLKAHQVRDGFLLENNATLDEKFGTASDSAVINTDTDATISAEYIGSVQVIRCIEADGAAILENRL
jgi:hypothetical protein